MKFGIDFGTSFSTMCTLDSNGKPLVLRDEVGLDKIPSVVYWGKDGVKVGQAAAEILGDTAGMAEDEKIETLGRIVKSVKRELEPGRTITLPDGKQITPVDVVSEILGYLKRNAEELHFHTTVKEVSLTHPATFTEAQKELLTNAAKKAGFSSVRLMPEPIAAALGYVASGADVGNGVIVFDFGGGTFDLAYLQKDADGNYHFPIQPLGDAMCGGDDFDQCIYDWAETQIKEKYGCAIADGFDVDLSFLMLCRRAKERLSRSDEAPMRYFIENIGRIHASTIKKINFEEMIKSRVDRTISLVGRMMNTLEGRNLPVETVLLVGGSTRIPLVAAKLKEMLPEKAPMRTTDTDTAVVMGSVYEMPKTETPMPGQSSDGRKAQSVVDSVNAALGKDKEKEIPPLLKQVQAALLRRQLGK